MQNKNTSSSYHDTNQYMSQIVAFENFLLDTKNEISGEESVYLAGMLARQSNARYLRQIRRLIFRKPEELDNLISKHYLCIGQNAPVYFIVRTNAEFLTVRLLSRNKKQQLCELEKWKPIAYFQIASEYAHKAGNRVLGEIFAHIYKNYNEIFNILSSYYGFLKKNQPKNIISSASPLWKRFAKVKNERNDKKESWERAGLSEKKKQHLTYHEFNQMINFEALN